jgi:flagellar biosynthesis chaperone FliJ
MQSLLKLEPKYLDLLVDENGNLDLTKENLHNVAVARITDLSLKQQSAIVEQALSLAQQGSTDALNEWIVVNENADASMRDSISTTKQLILSTLKAREASGELSKGYSDGFMASLENQLNAVQRVTDLALGNLDNTLSSSSNTAQEEVEDAFQKAMEYWDNRIGANRSLYDQIQNDIDLLEKKGKIAGSSYYEAQIKVENERLRHLKDQREEARGFLDDFAVGSEDWWEVANTLNDIENEIDDVTISIQELSDAMDQVHWDVFDEAHDRFDDLTTQLSNVRELLSADEDSFFNDEGEWTETGVAVLATHIQEIELYKSALADINKELADIDIGDFDSEQEYYDKLTELTDQQHEYTIEISNSEQSVVDMYESSIDAVEEYVDTLIDGYNDYIDSVKEALDAERDYAL